MDISVALGGGGSRGNAHIGVLRVLEQEGFHIRAVAGTSFGGLVAAFYASGHSPDEIEAIFSQVDQDRLYSRALDDGPSMLGTAGIQKFLDAHLKDRTFEDLDLPCAMPAADLRRGSEIVLKSGSLKDAVLATMAVPGVFPPRRSNDYELVDGGVLDPVPVSLARSLAPSLPVVAVALTPSPQTASHLFNVPLPQMIPAVLINRISHLRPAQALGIFMQSIEVANRMLSDLRLQVDQPEIIIRPDVGQVALLDKVDVHEIARRGEDAARAALPEIRDQFSLPARLGRTLRLLNSWK
ncbi:MAG: patatin-like phospholipase family protein [Chloroflexota bacterium]